MSSLPQEGVKDGGTAQEVQFHIHRSRRAVGICFEQEHLAFIYPAYWNGKSLDELVEHAARRAFRLAPAD